MSNDATRVQTTRYQSGIVALWSQACTADQFARAIAEQAGNERVALAVVLFSVNQFDGEAITRAMKAHSPSLLWCGCSSSGEITPDGHQDRGVIAMLLPERWFRASVTVIDDVRSRTMESIVEEVADARMRFLSEGSSFASEGLFAMTLIDGLSYSEESVTVALDRALEGIPLIGGSAGDDLQFRKSTQIGDGQCYHQGAVLALVECRLPFELFTDNNFVPTDHKLVVTESDPDRRIVHEFNAEPAAEAYAQAIGVEADQLNAQLFASNAVVVRIGGAYYCRSIQQSNPDGSLRFFCAIDNGLVLTVSRSEGMVRSTRLAIEAIESRIGRIDVMIGFDCVYRKIDAEHRGATERIASLYREKHFIGCNTYGEQFQSMHINQTFTGVAFGLPAGI